jgi:hypothetical protein
MRFPVGGEVVAAGFAVVFVVTVAAATDELVVDRSVDDVLDSAAVAEVSTGAVDEEDSALLRSEEPEEHPAAMTARTRKRTRRFTGAHHRGKP